MHDPPEPPDATEPRTIPSIVGVARGITPDAPDYPPALRDLARPPAELFLAGTFGALARAVAIVGTRRASADGKAVARALGRDLARAGVLVVSGAAHGIDAEAHAGALEVHAERETALAPTTLAVIATPLDAPYPAAHLPLLRGIVARGGGVLTEAATGARTFRASFLERNRIVAALAHAVVVVEAPARSGTLSTVAHARALGRPVFAVPWSPLDAEREGGVALLGRGQARACRDADDVLEALVWPRPEAARRPRAPRGRTSLGASADEARLLAALAGGARHADALVEATGLSVSAVQSALLALVLDGVVTDEGGLHRIVRRPL